MMEKRNTFAGRITRKILLWLFVILLGLSYFIFQFAHRVTSNYYIETYHNKMHVTNEYTRRVISDVYVAVTNNIYYLEQNLDNPDYHKGVMERIVKNGTRVRSCGISFVKDYYYPQKEHRFCPFAWRNVANPEVIWSENMGDADLDYLDADWFTSVIKGDSAKWSEPFYDGYDETTALAAYMVPIHDKTGRTVAVLGADISLDWLTTKLNETDTTITVQTPPVLGLQQQNSKNYIINRNGTFITHDEQHRILNDNFFKHVEPCGGLDAKELADTIERGRAQERDGHEKILFEGQKCYVFYTPVKYTDWTIVTVVPGMSIDKVGFFNGIMLLVVILLVLLVLVVVCYYCIKSGVEPLRMLTASADDMARFKFDTPLPDVSHNDELHQLRDSFENMQFELSNYINELKASKGSKRE